MCVLFLLLFAKLLACSSQANAPQELSESITLPKNFSATSTHNNDTTRSSTLNPVYVDVHTIQETKSATKIEILDKKDAKIYKRRRLGIPKDSTLTLTVQLTRTDIFPGLFFFSEGMLTDGVVEVPIQSNAN